MAQEKATKTAAKSGKKALEAAIQITPITVGSVSVAVLGMTPFICNRMAAKAKQDLLFPQQRNRAELAARLKHDPLMEYRESPYISRDDADPTLIRHLATAFKNAVRSAALDTPGATKAAIGRLVWIEGEWVSIFGTPKLHMGVVRMRDMARTPDIRTRAILPEWAAFCTISYAKPMLNEKVVMQLLANAGITNGMGDWRQEKGSGSYGSFKIVSALDADLKRVMQEGGRDAQIAAMEDPKFYSEESQELYEWVYAEIERRGKGEMLGRALEGTELLDRLEENGYVTQEESLV